MTKIPALDADTDNLSAAILYARSGLYLLPVKPGTKHPGSRVGDRWQDKSSRDIEILTGWFAGSSDGIAIDLGRSGLLVIDVDHPEMMPGWLSLALIEAAGPYQSTRPDSEGRGHYVFKQPAGRRIGCGKSGLAGMGLDVKGCGGVIIAQPTEHPEGGCYRWVVDGEVPELPPVIGDKLADTEQAQSSVTDEEVRKFLADNIGASKHSLMSAWPSKFRTEVAQGNSRHDSMVSILTAALEESKVGYFPARDVVDILREAFVDTMIQESGDRRNIGESRARAEFEDMLPWGVAQAKATPLATIREKTERNVGDDFSALWASPALPSRETPESGSAGQPGGKNTASCKGIDEFFDSRESLQQIYQASMSRMAAPWAVLAFCAARALTQVRPHVTLPPIIGGRGSLNWFAALVASSGGGKGAAQQVSKELVLDDMMSERQLGSGEGMVACYQKAGIKGAPPEYREAVLFVADEADTMAALSSRSGSTAMSVLRQGFSGEPIGHSYIKRESNITLPAHSYRMCLVVSVQPTRAGVLMDDVSGGTTQRFMWFPSTDPRISEKPPWFPGPLRLPGYREWLYPTEIGIPGEARDLIMETRVKNMRGEVAAIDGHALFCREKFAFALAVLDGRTRMSGEDWELSGVAAEMSQRTRESVEEQLVESREEEARERGKLQGVSSVAAEDEKVMQHNKRRERIGKWVQRKLSENGPMKQRDLFNGLNSKNGDRNHLQYVLGALKDVGVVEEKDDGTWVLLQH